MLSLKYPEILPHLQLLDYGLQPVRIKTEDRISLIIKATKEVILTARNKNKFKVYLVKEQTDSSCSLGLVTAFFDDHDEPLVVMTPMHKEDELMKDLVKLFTQDSFDLYFFDENNRELFGVNASNIEFNRFHTLMTEAEFTDFVPSKAQDFIKKMQTSFAYRTSIDDKNAFTILLNERLYNDDYAIIDARDKITSFQTNENPFAITTLEREGDPGPMQERDIAIIMARLFKSEQIFLNPFRADTDKELTDVLIVYDHVLLFIQAKDSPNTEKILNRTIERKRKTTRAHIKKATDQIRGALSYAQKNGKIILKGESESIIVPTKGKQLIGLIVVRELFDDDYVECSSSVLKAIRDLEAPIALLDFPQLHILTQNFANSIQFTNGIYSIVDMALEHEEFPKSVWNGAPLKN